MKKYYFLLVAMMMAIVSVGLTACGSDDDDEPQNTSIVGTWKTSGTEDGVNYVSLIQFTKDGKFNGVQIWTENGENEIEVSKGTYTASNDVLMITETDEDGEADPYIINYQLKGKQLILTFLYNSVTFTQTQDSEIEKYLKYYND